MNLEQEKLDVKFKTRANPFNWRGQFTPEFVEYILNSFAKPGDLILDPFSGSGTVLAEAARKDLQCYGYEINPSAFLMSKFFSFTTLKLERRLKFLQRIELKLNLKLKNLNGQLIYVDNPDYRVAYKNLLNFAKGINEEIVNDDEKVFFFNMLFLSEKDKQLKVKDSILKSFNYLKNALLGLPYSNNIIDAKLKDARTVHKNFIKAVDLIVTSPPYINVFNYHQNYRGITETLGYDLLKVAESEFGSNRKNRGNRFRTVIQYCLDMELSVKSFWKALRQDGKIVIVVGRESNVRKTPFYNGNIVKEILDELNGFKSISNLERSFTNKFGDVIKEDIIIAQKNEFILEKEIGRLIALRHLKNALTYATDETIIADLNDAIKNIDLIMPSPEFNTKNIVNGEQYSAQRKAVSSY